MDHERRGQGGDVQGGSVISTASAFDALEDKRHPVLSDGGDG